MDSENVMPDVIELTRSQYTVGWVCALTEELTAATVMLDNVHEMPVDLSQSSTDDNVYVFGSVGKHNVVLTGLPKGKIGVVSAAVVARTMVDSFPSIKFGFMVGIGGGVPSEENDIRLGDVVVSSPIGKFPGVVQWDLGKAMDGSSFERTGALNGPPRVLLSALTHLESIHERKGSSIPEYLKDLEVKERKLMRSYGRSDFLKDVLFSSDSSHRNQGSSGRNAADCEYCDTVKVIERESRDEPITIHYGLIASGNQVIKDANLRDKLNTDLGGKVLCVEMEAAGLMESFPCLVIRGICDYADSHKNKRWQKYAALVAAAYAKELLMVVPCRAVEQMATIQSIFSGISDKLDQISRHMENNRQSNHHKAILEWLTPVSYDSQQHSTFNRRQQGTCQWFLQSKEFGEFLQKDSKIMFCEGFPGAGKTILASIVINHLQNDHRSLPGEKIGLAFIFGDFIQRSHQRPVDILASLIKQLLRNQSHVSQKIIDIYDKFREISASSRSKDDNLIFAEMLQQVIASVYTRVFIVIDALDELLETQSLLLDIFNILKATSATLFATSRPIEKIQQQIQGSFEGHIPFKIRAQDEDIERYTDERLLRLKLFSDEVTEYSDEAKSQLKIDIKRKISDAADGVFLLAKFHIDALEGKTTPRRIRESLETLYTGSDAYAQAYKKTIERINCQRPEHRLLAKRVLQWLTCSEGVLSNLELRHALSINTNDTMLPNQDSLENTHTILDVCMGLVIAEGSDRSIRLLHYTTMEFLRSNLDCLDHDLDLRQPAAQSVESAAQKYITETCVTYLSLLATDIRLGYHIETLESRLAVVELEEHETLMDIEMWREENEEEEDEDEEDEEEENEEEENEEGEERRNRHENLYWEWSLDPLCNLAWPYDLDNRRVKYHYKLLKYQILSLYPLLPYALEHWIHHAFKASVDEATSADIDIIILRLLASDLKVAMTIRLAKHYGVHSYTLGMTGLHLAAYSGLKGAAIALLENKHDPKSTDDYGQTPLHYAVEQQNEKMAEILLRSLANPATAGQFGWTPLLLSVNGENIAMVKLLLDFSKRKRFFIEKQKALVLAASKGSEAVFKLLLEHGASPAYKIWEDSDPQGLHVSGVPFDKSRLERTILSLVVERGDQSILDLLLSSGLDPDPQDRDGQTPLFSAALNGHEAIVRELLRLGVNPGHRDSRGQTPLLLATKNGHAAITRELLQCQVNPDPRDEKMRRTPLLLASKHGHEAIARQLLQKGANPNSMDSKGQTPLFFAVESGHAEVVKLLLEQGADPDPKPGRKTHDKWTHLLRAVKKGDEKIVSLLLEAGVNPNSGYPLGFPPLYLAAKDGREDIVSLLLTYDSTHVNWPAFRETPYCVALYHGHQGVAEILERHGGKLFDGEHFRELQDWLESTRNALTHDIPIT